MVELMPPSLQIESNLRVRLNVLCGVLLELTDICGVDIENSLKLGVRERDVIERITLSFLDDNQISHGRIRFIIDWDKMEILGESDDVPFATIDFSGGYAKVLDNHVLVVTESIVEQLKQNYNIAEVIATFRYREKYRENDEVHKATREYMHHVCAGEYQQYEDMDFARSLETIFQGMDCVLKVSFEIE